MDNIIKGTEIKRMYITDFGQIVLKDSEDNKNILKLEELYKLLNDLTFKKSFKRKYNHLEILKFKDLNLNDEVI